MKKFKILYICDWGYVLGGAGVIMLSNVEGLRRKGHEVRIFSSDYNPMNSTIFSDYTYKGFAEKKICRWFYQIFNFHSYSKLKKILKEFEPDIIHLHDIFYQVSPSVLLAIDNIPVVMTLHSYEIICPTGAIVKSDGSRCISPGKHDLRCAGSISGYVYETVKQSVHKILLKKISFYIVPSESMRLDFSGQNIIQSPIKVLHHGISLPAFKPLQSFNRILYVGRLSKEKGVESLIKAFKIINRALPEVCLEIVGNGPESQKLKNLCASLNLQHRVKFYDYIEKKDILDFYVNSTVVVVPSICPESFSLVGIEALSAGRPVIGSNLGAIPEWLIDGKCGFLFSPGDIDDLSDKAIKILKNRKDLKKMSLFCREYSKQYSVIENINSLEDIYEKFINKKYE